MIIHQHDRSGYERPIYAPENGQVYGQDRRGAMRKANAAYMYGKPLTAELLRDMDKLTGLATALFGKAKKAAKKAAEQPVKTPYTNSAATPCSAYARAYVREYDGALMVELGGYGFVSETWAVRNGLVHDRKLPEAVAARKEARKTRKERKTTKAARRLSV